MPVTLSFRDFGPLGAGSVRLAPLTVFIGPNNSGKSVLAMLCYGASRVAPALPSDALLRRHLRPSRGARGLPPVSYRSSMIYADLASQRPPLDTIGRFYSALARNQNLPTARMDESLIAFFRTALQSCLISYARDVRSEIARCFGGRLSDLGRTGPRRGRRRFRVAISSDTPRWSIEIQSTAKNTSVDISAFDVPAALRQVRRRSAAFFEAYDIDYVPEDFILRELLDLFFAYAFTAFPPYSYYLPAARSGFLQSHRAIASSVVSRAPYVGIEDMRIPKMGGVIADFISHLLELPTNVQSEAVNEVADYLESTLHGAIRLEVRPQAYPDIWYEVNGNRFPLHRTSSMVSELAPIVLYLRYMIEPGELLVIEEPESHLHPASQLILARALARLVRLDVRVLVTTHSDYFLTQLNNLIRVATLSESGKGALAEDALRTRDVHAYLFSDPYGIDGTQVRQLRVTGREGISDEDFARVAEPLYAERVALERQVLEDL